MWRRSGKVDPEQAYLTKRSSQFLVAVQNATKDIREWAESRPAQESLVASAFTNRCLLDYGTTETASRIFDELPQERAAAIQKAAREMFRKTDPALLSAQRSGTKFNSDIAALFVSVLTESVESLTSHGSEGLTDSDLLSITGRRMAKAAWAVKKPSNEQLEQRGIDNVVTITLLSQWIDLVHDMPELPVIQRHVDTVHEIRFDSANMNGNPPRTADDFLGTTRIEDGMVTLDARGVEKTSSERLTDAYLATQVGEFHLAAFLYSLCERDGILTDRRRAEMRVVTMVSEGDRQPIENSPLGTSSEERLQILMGDSPRPYLHDIPVDIDPKLEEILDKALLAEAAGRTDEFIDLTEQIAQRQTLPPELLLTYAYRCLQTNRNTRCLEECRKLLDVPNYHSEDTRLRALEYLGSAAMQEGLAKEALLATLEALHINISSPSALMTLASLAENLNNDMEMSLLLKLRVISILRAEGNYELAEEHMKKLKRKFNGDSAQFA
jgi:hypothetical protein